MNARAAPGLEVRLLGRFVIRRAGQEVAPAAFGGRLVQTLIRVLVSRRGSFVSKDVLAEALWSERLPADPAANIEVPASRARRALGDPSLILTVPGGYAFAGKERCQPLAEDAYADWAQDYRRTLTRMHLEAFRERLATEPPSWVSTPPHRRWSWNGASSAGSTIRVRPEPAGRRPAAPGAPVPR